MLMIPGLGIRILGLQLKFCHFLCVVCHGIPFSEVFGVLLLLLTSLKKKNVGTSISKVTSKFQCSMIRYFKDVFLFCFNPYCFMIFTPSTIIL